MPLRILIVFFSRVVFLDIYDHDVIQDTILMMMMMMMMMMMTMTMMIMMTATGAMTMKTTYDLLNRVVLASDFFSMTFLFSIKVHFFNEQKN